MPRPFRNAIQVGPHRQKQKNGDVYVYERKTRYNPETKKTATIGKKLLGKIIKGTTELVPTRPKKPAGSRKAAPKEASEAKATRKRTGLTDILELLGKESGIDDDIRACFPEGDAEKLLSVARFWVATGGHTLPRMAAWQVMHEVPYPGVVSDDVAGDLFGAVGVNENAVQGVFRRRAGRLEKGTALAFDSTTVGSWSEGIHEVRPGFNKDGDGLEVTKILTLYAEEDETPVAFAGQPGNVPDVVSVVNTLEQLSALDLDDPTVVTDNGFYSQANLAEFQRRGKKFLTLVDTRVSWVREALEAVRERLGDGDAICPFDPDTCGSSIVREQHVFAKENKQSGEPALGGTLYVHVFRSLPLQTKRESDFNRRLFEIKGLLEEGAELSESARRWGQTYLEVEEGNGRRRVTFRNGAIREAKRDLGVFALATNREMDAFRALELYRLRNELEDHWGQGKRHCDGRRTRCHSGDVLRGRQFAQFAALCYRAKFCKKLKEIKAALAKAAPAKTLAQLKLEKKLLSWLGGHSVQDIFDWFDCIQTTTADTPAGRFRWSTGSVARDRLFLDLLGLPQKV